MSKAKATIYKIIISRRTIRQFQQRPIPRAILKRLINAARLAPSAANLQPIEFIIVSHKVMGARIFPHLRWANYITPYGIPAPDKKPTAYILVLLNKANAQSKYAPYDIGAAVENILLAAWGLGIGSCWMHAIDRDKIKKVLRIPKHYQLDSVISLGYKAELPIVEEYRGSVRYWKDKRGILHVPKKSTHQIIYKEII